MSFSALPVVEVPGYREAVLREVCLRDEAFLGLGEEIAGLPAQPMTLWHLLALEQLKNGYVVACEFDDWIEEWAHALQFAWIVSPEYRVPRGRLDRLRLWWARRRFLRRARAVVPWKLAAAIRAYYGEALYDAPRPPADHRPRRPYLTSAAASLVDLFAEAGYGWSEEQILHLPLKRLWQYWRRSRLRLEAEPAVSNPSDLLLHRALAGAH